MPRAISEIPQGRSFGRSSDGGGLADRATRQWKILLNSPGESFDIAAAVGVNIGDPWADANPIPCVSLDVKGDGESRLVRIVTAEYRSSAGVDPQSDPKSQPPEVRPAMYSMTTSLTEIAAWGGLPIIGGVSQGWQPAVNPAGDLVDGLTRLEPVVTINIDQYSYTDQSGQLAYTGYVNSDDITFSGLTILKHCAMLQGISSRPVVETFGGIIFRGFMVTFSFGVRAHWTVTRDGFLPIGWDMAVPLTGFNIKNTGFGNAQVDQRALVLEHKDGKVWMNGDNPRQLAGGTAGRKVRAMVTIPATGSDDGGFVQNPCAQPIPLNDDGTPRNTDNFPLNQKVLINRICLQPEMAFGNNFSAFGIRMIG